EWAASLQYQLERVLHLSSRVDALRRFVVINYLAVVKIAKKFEKTTASHATRSIDVAGDLLLQPFYAGSYVDHLYSQTASVLDSLVQALVAPVPLPSLDASCPICLYPHTSPVTLGCHHTFCWSCLAKAAAHHIHACPLCREVQSIDPRDYEIDGLVKRFGNLFTQLQFELSSQPTELSAIAMPRMSSPFVSPPSPRPRAASLPPTTAHAVLAHAKQVADDLLAAVRRQYAMAPPSSTTVWSTRRNSASSSSSMVLDPSESHPAVAKGGSTQLVWPRVISIASPAVALAWMDDVVDRSGCHMLALNVYLSGSGDIVAHSGALVPAVTQHHGEEDVFLSEVSTDELAHRYNIWTLHHVLTQLRQTSNPMAILLAVCHDDVIPPLMALLASSCRDDHCLDNGDRGAFSWTSSMLYLASGNHYQLLAMHGHRMSLPTLSDMHTVALMGQSIPLGYCRDLEQLHVSHVCVDAAVVTAAFAADAHRRGLRVFVSNVDSARIAWNVLEDMGGIVDGMVSQRPDMLGTTLVQHALAQDRRGGASTGVLATFPTSTAITDASPRGSLQMDSCDGRRSGAVHPNSFGVAATSLDKRRDDEEAGQQSHVFAAGDPVEIAVEGAWYAGVILEAQSSGREAASMSYSVLWWRSDNSQRRSTKVAPAALRAPSPQYQPSYLGLGIDAAYGALKAAIAWASLPFTTTSTG
ncbi:hypothetical protein DYB32_009126, partial [Aphanomyces invadans]